MLRTILYILWPIEPCERKKFTVMAALAFAILLNYSIIYSLKESIILPVIGAQGLSFIELWLVLPAMFIFALTYLCLSKHITSKATLFYLICGFILSFFIIFALVLYPNMTLITPSSAWSASLMLQFPHAKWFIIILCHWPLALYSIFSDLWIYAIFSLLFWQYSNNVVPTEQAKRFYPMFILVGNVALIISGLLLKKIALHSDNDSIIWQLSIAITVIGLITMLLFGYLHRTYHPLYPDKIKVSLSLKESILLISKSRYLWLLAMLMISYGLAINLSQSMWKSQSMELYNSTKSYLHFMAEFQTWVGITSVVATFIGGIVVRQCSWRTSSLATPIIMLITGGCFFVVVLLKPSIMGLSSRHYYLLLTVIIGSIHMVLSKATKFTLFDSSKELAYIPLDLDLKDKGKAAVDLLGERLGKSGASCLQSLLFICLPNASYGQLALWFLALYLAIIALWITSALALNRQYIEILKD